MHAAENIATLCSSHEVLTVQEVANLLRIGRNTAYEAIRRGELPAIKLCGRILVPKAAVQAMLGLGVTHGMVTE